MSYETTLEKMSTIRHIDSPSAYNIMLNLDNRLFNQMLVLIYNLSSVCIKTINLFVLQSDFTSEQKVQLTKFCSAHNILLILIDVNAHDFNGFGKHRLPSADFFYLQAPELLPSWVDRVLHLDIDTVITRDIGALYNIDFESSWLAAMNEYNIPFFNTYFRDSINNDFKYRSLYSSESIYNGGVLLLNLNMFRSRGVKLDDFIKIIKKEDFITSTAEQTMINRFTGTNIKLFPKAFFNCFVSQIIESRQCFTNISKSNEIYSFFSPNEDELFTIIHFAGKGIRKPWNALKAIAGGIKEFDLGSYSTPVATQIKKFTSLWWDNARHIPVQNYEELVARSIKLNSDKEFQSKLALYSFREILPGYANIAPLGRATQSSTSEWSQGPDEADCALTGKLKEGCDHAFHTKREEIAWWMVDLQDYYKIRMVKIASRDTWRERYRSDKLEIIFSLDGKDWVDCGSLHTDDDGLTYTLSIPALLFRFVKIQVRNQYLHFKQVGIYI